MDKLIDRENPQKLYIQLCEILKKRIESKEWSVGSQIPTEEELCRMYGVSKATVRAAILELVRLGYLMRQQGKGTFVCKRVISEGLVMWTSLREPMLEAGVTFSTRVLAQTVIMPTDDLDIKLDIPEDKHIIYIKRLRMVDNEPILLEESYIPYHICPPLLEEEVVNKSLFELLEKEHGIKITKVKNYIEIIYLNADEGRLLKLPEGSPALLLTQYLYSRETPIMYTRSIKKPDRFKFSIELERKAV